MCPTGNPSLRRLEMEDEVEKTVRVGILDVR